MTLSYLKEIFYFKRKQLNILSWTTDLYEKRWINNNCGIVIEQY